ncbi:hypothetical protein FACS1894102_3070 [Spirochaetia bacterium]|nr:hypothetical protein FACS1894102_3070 [Spirochaetia bacterium]
MKSFRKKLCYLRYFVGLCFLSTFALVPAVSQESDDAIALPEARVSAEKETSQFITQEQMERRGDTDLWQAMRWVPGVFVTNGGQRNEADFKLRGFSTKDVPVYLDGIPWGDHYNAQVDYSGFLTGDLESIQINKGYSSVLLGSGNLGGAVIMRTAKPKENLEIGVKTSWNFDKEGYGGNTETATIGTKQNLFYAKTTFQWRDVDHWSLPDSFQATDGSPQQTGKRYASDSSTMKISGIAGFTPSEAWDIYATYSYSQSARGLSPISVGSSFAVWEWPYADRHSASLNAELELDRFYVKAKGFFDKFDNRLYIYNSEKGGRLT